MKTLRLKAVIGDSDIVKCQWILRLSRVGRDNKMVMTVETVKIIFTLDRKTVGLSTDSDMVRRQ